MFSEYFQKWRHVLQDRRQPALMVQFPVNHNEEKQLGIEDFVCECDRKLLHNKSSKQENHLKQNLSWKSSQS